MKVTQPPQTDFWRARPTLGWRGYSLLIPSAVSAVGLASFAVLSLSFTELAVLPEAFRVALVLLGAFSLAAGGEVGTLFSVMEIYRKPCRGVWDWAALVTSGAATLGAFLLAFAALLGASTNWSPLVRTWGPIAQGLLIALDSYGLFVELGLYLSEYDARMRVWRAEAEEHERNVRAAAWELAHNDAQPGAEVAQVARSVAPVAQPPAQVAATEAQPGAGLSPVARRAAVSAWLARNPGATVAQVAQRFGVSQTTARNDIKVAKSII